MVDWRSVYCRLYPDRLLITVIFINLSNGVDWAYNHIYQTWYSKLKKSWNWQKLKLKVLVFEERYPAADCIPPGCGLIVTLFCYRNEGALGHSTAKKINAWFIWPVKWFIFWNDSGGVCQLASVTVITIFPTWNSNRLATRREIVTDRACSMYNGLRAAAMFVYMELNRT